MSITISDTEPRVQYTATAGQTSFTVGFEFFDNADLKVFNGTSLLTFSASPANATQYSVSGAGQTGGGSITLGSPGATVNDIITISRDLAIERSTDFPTSGAFQIGSLNTELDKIIAMCQQLERDLKFSPRAATTTSNTFDITFPNLVANKVLAVNSSGNGLEFTQDVTDIITIAGIASDVTTVSGIAANVTTCAGISSDITAVANDATDIGAVAGKATEIGRLGTADAVADLAILGTSDIVTDMNLLATSANVTAMGLLATSANITAMGLLGTSSNVTAMGLLGTSAVVEDLSLLANADVIADMALLADSDVIADMNTLATTDIVSDLNTLATTDIVNDLNQLATTDFVSDLNAVEGIKANVTTVANNLSGINNFAERYRVAASDPGDSLDAGDLVFNTTANVLKYYNGSSWNAIVAGALTDVVQDGTPQLGGNLDLNNNDITGTGNINITGTSNAKPVWESKSSGFTAEAQKSYFIDTSSAAVTATLPSSASIGDEVRFIDVAGTFDTNNLTIGRNSHKIQGDASDLTVATERAGFALVYYNAAQGWLIKDK